MQYERELMAKIGCVYAISYVNWFRCVHRTMAQSHMQNEREPMTKTDCLYDLSYINHLTFIHRT